MAVPQMASMPPTVPPAIAPALLGLGEDVALVRIVVVAFGNELNDEILALAEVVADVV